MLTFFRQVRHKLLGEHRFSRYLLYAAGEILLVVLGILIALKINGINTRMVERQQEKEYLAAIAGNLEEDIRGLEYGLQRDSVHLNSYTRLVRAFSNESIRADREELMRTIHSSAVINYFTPQTAVFEEMKSSGNLGLIRADSLRYALMEYYNLSRKILESQSINNDFILQHKGNSIDRYLDMNSLVESRIPEQWQAEISPFDDSFFRAGNDGPGVEEFARSISLMKAGVFINHNWKLNLLRFARRVRSDIRRYLEDR